MAIFNIIILLKRFHSHCNTTCTPVHLYTNTQTMRLGQKEIEKLTPILADFDEETKSRMLLSSLVEKMRSSNADHDSKPSQQHKGHPGHRGQGQSHGRHNNYPRGGDNHSQRRYRRNLSDEDFNDYDHNDEDMSRSWARRGQGHGDRASSRPRFQNNRYADDMRPGASDEVGYRYTGARQRDNNYTQRNQGDHDNDNEEQNGDFGNFVSKMQRR